nr:glycoside hydrolase family 97 C-terminal domain-containing protein [Shewanella gelidimarina]
MCQTRAWGGTKGKDWFLGAITDDNARNIDIKLDFLTQSVREEVLVYQDGKPTNRRNNPYDDVIETKIVAPDEVLSLSLASSGETAIQFKALD